MPEFLHNFSMLKWLVAVVVCKLAVWKRTQSQEMTTFGYPYTVAAADK
jgi:hypothetical protein